MKVAPPVAVDFETHAIELRPAYPPKPVGVAIQVPGEKPEYLAWGHPLENNCTRDVAVRRLKQIGWRRGATEGIVFQNGKFDVDVGETHLGLGPIDPLRYHDTLFLAFLADPHSPTLSLKPLAARYLKMAPTERDELRDWIVANVPGATPKHFGAHIAKAPGGLVGKYSKGDAIRTARLFAKLHPEVLKRGMGAAYDRERLLLPILLQTEREGVRVYHQKLRRDVLRYGGKVDADGHYTGGVIGELDARIRKILKAPNLDVDKKEALADALEKSDLMTSWKKTKTGKRSVAKDSLLEGLEASPVLYALLLYRGAVSTCVRTFMAPWLRMADANNGYIFTTWNQVRQSHDESGLVGARTGRLSSSPNFQNIPTLSSPNYEAVIKALKAAKLIDKLAPFPMVRSYLAPDPNELFLDRDYSQQELRILGHYEGTILMDKYNDDPWLDVHELAMELINGMLGTSFIRRQIKDTGFGLIYGMGLDKLALKIDSDKKTAKVIKTAYLAIFPGLKELDDALKWRGRLSEPIRTWGGREYFVEPPRFSKKYGRMQTFDYKLLNVLIQGSAADTTKQAVLNYAAHPKREARFLLTVHDEILASSPRGDLKRQMGVLRESMESVRFDVPMLSEGEWGTDWADLKTFDKKGVVKYRGS